MNALFSNVRTVFTFNPPQDSQEGELTNPEIDQVLKGLCLAGRCIALAGGLTSAYFGLQALVAGKTLALAFSIFSVYFDYNMFRFFQNAETLIKGDTFESFFASGSFALKNIFTGEERLLSNNAIKQVLLKNTWNFEIFYDLAAALETHLRKES